MRPKNIGGTTIRVAKVIFGTEVEGPGKRVAIWTQGCSIKCPGCINQELQNKNGGYDIDVYDLALEIKKSGLTKVTILGGEPLDQAPQLMNLVWAIRTRNPGIETMLFTGYEEKEAKKILSPLVWHAFDVIITGPYVCNKPDDRAWIGSSNQVIHRVSERSKDYTWPKKDGFQLEFSFDESGAYVNGL